MQSARSTYRSLLREARRLPHIYLQQFFRVKVRSYFRENILPKLYRPKLVDAKLLKARKELRRLQRANDGDKKALEHVLDLAYGRKGKLKHELMERFLSNPKAPLPPRIIPEVERSRPPSYSPELTTLLMSIHARTTKPLKPDALRTPPTLPERADPSSEEARLLGPFSRRREVNIRWRFHTAEVKRTLPPLELTRREEAENPKHIRGTGAEELQLLQEVERLARSPYDGIPMPRRERKCDEKYSPPASPTLPTRFLRRRYRELLSRIPILIPQSKGQVGCTTELSPLAISNANRGDMTRVGQATDDDLDWIVKSELAAGDESSSRTSNKKQIQ